MVEILKINEIYIHKDYINAFEDPNIYNTDITVPIRNIQKISKFILFKLNGIVMYPSMEPYEGPSNYISNNFLKYHRIVLILVSINKNLKYSFKFLPDNTIAIKLILDILHESPITHKIFKIKDQTTSEITESFMNATKKHLGNDYFDTNENFIYKYEEDVKKLVSSEDYEELQNVREKLESLYNIEVVEKFFKTILNK